MSTPTSRSRGFAHLILLAIIAIVIIGALAAYSGYGSQSLTAAVGTLFGSASTSPISANLNGTWTTVQKASVLGAGDVGTFTVQYRVRAGSKDIFVASPNFSRTSDSTANATGAGALAFGASDTNSGDQNVGGTNGGAIYKVTAGTTRTFSLTVNYSATNPGYTGVQITGIRYGLTSTLGSTYTNLVGFKTGNVSMSRIAKTSYDYNNDSLVNSTDVKLLNKVIGRTSACPSTKICDVNGDGSVDVADSIRLVNLSSAVPAGSLAVSVGSTNPIAQTISVSSSTTIGVKLLNFNVAAKSRDVTITNLPIVLNTSTERLASVFASVRLMKGSQVINAKYVPIDGPSQNIVFTNINQTIVKDTTANYSIVVDLKGDAYYPDGTTISASTFGNGWSAVDSIGNSIAQPSSVTGNTMTLSGTDNTTGALTASAASNNPGASQIAVSSSTTTGVKLLSFNLKAKNQNLTIKAMKVQFNTSDDDLNDVINNVQLVKGSCTNSALSAKTIANGTGTDGGVTFSSLNEVIIKDSTVNYTICADLKADSAYADGATLIASTTVAGWTVSDIGGASVSPSAAVGGNTQTLTANGFSISLGSPTATLLPAPYPGGYDSASFTIPFTVTAGDTAVFIASKVSATTSNAGKTGTAFARGLGVVYATTTSSTATTVTLGSGAVVAADGYGASSLDANNNFYVAPNTSRTFKFTQTVRATANGVAGIRAGLMIRGINYSDTSTMGTTYYTSGLSTFRTDDVVVYSH